MLLLNADCFLAPDFLARLRPRLWEPGVGSVAPKLLRAAGPGRPLGEIDTAGLLLDRRRKNNLVGHGEPSERYSTPGVCFGADGAAALFRRETLRDCAIDGRAPGAERPGEGGEVPLRRKTHCKRQKTPESM